MPTSDNSADIAVLLIQKRQAAERHKQATAT
jgi:hypothetical protein